MQFSTTTHGKKLHYMILFQFLQRNIYVTSEKMEKKNHNFQFSGEITRENKIFRGR